MHINTNASKTLIVTEYTEHPLLGMFGPSQVNVLKINIALDQLK